MHLRDYLDLPESLTVSALKAQMQRLGSTIKADAQIRQWIQRKPDGSYKRAPSPANAHILELATDGKVTRKDMRPHDWAVIWPELAYEGPERRVGPPTRRVGEADRRKAVPKRQAKGR